MITLQNFIFPEPTICTEHDLYFHPIGEFGFSQRNPQVWLKQGSVVAFDTYFNLFNLTKWSDTCSLDGLYVEVFGTGQVEVRVFQAIPSQSWEIMHSEMTTLDPDTPHRADLSHYAGRSSSGLIYVEVKSMDKDGATVTGGRFLTGPDAVEGSNSGELPNLAVSITTFKREKQVRETVARLDSFLKGFEFGDHINVQVVDNGNSAEITPTANVTPITNPNYGGAGGFARGLLEAEKSGATHCLFMDDDASFHMENILRAYMLLALAKDRKTAVAGAMINNTHKWAMWENGAFFDGSCHPLFSGTDLRNKDAVFAMENESARLDLPTLYGGWWFFAFAIDQVKRHPFPFFVRGDDISFSLMNDFKITVLNGIVSFQDDFSEKESAQTLYLDVRNHLIQHLVTEGLERSAVGTARVPMRFIMRSLLRLHYETAAAQLLAWKDVMQGPQFFDENIDMAARRATIKDMMKTEVWKDINPSKIKEKRKLTLKSHHDRHRLGIRTLNGHLVPFSGSRWDRIILKIGDRGNVSAAFGASEITYLNTAGDKGYTVTQSKGRFFSVLWDMIRTSIRFVLNFDTLKQTWRTGYGSMTTRDYWNKKLN